jgi:hypothetical protein
MFLVTISTRDRGMFEIISHKTDAHQAEQEALAACRYSISHSIIRSTVVPIGEASSRH